MQLRCIAGASAADAGGAIWSAKIRYLGVGAMLIGGIWTLFSLRNSLASGIKSGLAAARKGGGLAVAETERDLPMKWMLVALAVFVIPLWMLYHAIVQSWGVSLTMTIIMIVAGFLFVSVSAYLAGLVGSSNNPVSGITIATILFFRATGLVRNDPAALGAVEAMQAAELLFSSALGVVLLGEPAPHGVAALGGVLVVAGISGLGWLVGRGDGTTDVDAVATDRGA